MLHAAHQSNWEGDSMRKADKSMASMSKLCSTTETENNRFQIIVTDDSKKRDRFG